MQIIHFSITLGNLLEIIVLIVGGISFLSRIVAEFTTLGTEIEKFNDKFKEHGSKIEKVEQSIERLTEITSQIAVQEQKINHLETYMDTQSKQTTDKVEGLQQSVATLTVAIAELIAIKKGEADTLIAMKKVEIDTLQSTRRPPKGRVRT